MADYPVSTGVSTMSSTYIPEIWAAKTLVKFYKSTVFSDIANTDYEGEIKGMGDKVHIRIIPDISIRRYTIGQKLRYERPATSDVELDIDKGYYYGIDVNDVERAQSDLQYVEKWTDDGGEQLKIYIDADVLQNTYSDASSSNSGATAGVNSASFDLGTASSPESIDKTNILDYIVDMGSVLDEQNVPTTGRWLLLPPLFCGMIKKSDLKDASLAGDSKSIMRNGKLGEIDRFMIYNTNNLNSTSGVFDVMFGHPTGITFASQLVRNETIKNPDDFGDILRGLQVYGYKVIKAEAIGHFVAQKA